MLELYDQIEEAKVAIRQAWDGVPRAGLILGSGLGGLVDEIEVEASLAYEDIPHFPRSTALSHAGQLVMGRLEGVQVVIKNSSGVQITPDTVTETDTNNVEIDLHPQGTLSGTWTVIVR